MDYDLWLRLAARHRFVHIAQKTAFARIHGQTKTFGSSSKHLTECIEFLERYYETAEGLTWGSTYRNLALGHWLAARGFYWLNQGNYRRAVQDFTHAIRYDRRYVHNRGIRNAFLWAAMGDRVGSRIQLLLKKRRETTGQAVSAQDSDLLNDLMREMVA
jgi:tetratricopeptide (TPR) repeat protein